MQPTNIPQQPNPIQLAMQNQQPNAAQQLQQQTQQADVQQQAEQQQAGMIKDSAAIDLQQQQATFSKAMAQLNPKADSGNKTFDTASKVGGALSTNNYSNRCLAFVDDQTGNKDRSPTAFADFQKNAAAGQIQTQGIPPKGARIYFAPTSDNPAGHVMLSNGDGTGTGATPSNGIKTFSIKDWSNYASQQYIGYSTSGK